MRRGQYVDLRSFPAVGVRPRPLKYSTSCFDSMSLAGIKRRGEAFPFNPGAAGRSPTGRRADEGRVRESGNASPCFAGRSPSANVSCNPRRRKGEAFPATHSYALPH